MPTNGEFTVKCKNCGHDFKENPAAITKEVELFMQFCHQCKESQVLRNDGTITTIFAVMS